MRSELIRVITDSHKMKTGEMIDSNEVSFLPYNSRSSDLLFVFIEKEDYPKYLFKITHSEELNKRLKNEYEVLSKIIRLRSPLLNNSFPEPIYQGVIRGHQVILETIIEGLPLNEFICLSRNSQVETERYFSMATRWLSELQKKVYPKLISLNEFLLSKNVVETVNLYKKKLSFSAEEEERIKALFKEAKSIEKIQVPLVLQHHDFSPENMLYNKENNKICVLDWEYALFSGIPLLDLLNFFINYKFIISGYENAQKNKISYKSFFANIHNPVPTLSDFKEIFYEDNWRSNLAGKYVNEYCSRMSLDKRLLKILFLLFIFKHLFCKKDFLSIFLEKGRPIIF